LTEESKQEKLNLPSYQDSIKILGKSLSFSQITVFLAKQSVLFFEDFKSSITSEDAKLLEHKIIELILNSI
jgi:hypothetical protein